MAEIKNIGVSVRTVATITLNDAELGALDALAGYGVDAFLQVFYKHLGRAYLEPHEAGLRSFLKAASGCAGMTNSAAECREFLGMEEMARRKRLVRG